MQSELYSIYREKICISLRHFATWLAKRYSRKVTTPRTRLKPRFTRVGEKLEKPASLDGCAVFSLGDRALLFARENRDG